MDDRFTSALSSPEMTVVYAIIPLCTVQPFLYLRFTENPKRQEVKSGGGNCCEGNSTCRFQPRGGSGSWGQHFSLPLYATHILDGPEVV